MLLRLCSLMTLLCFAVPALAVLDIEVTGAGEHQTPMTIVSFEGEDLLNQRVSEIVGNDLIRTGLFKLIAPAGKNPHLVKDINFSDWKKVDSRTPIQPVILGSNANALAAAKLLDEMGYWIPAIRPPTVPSGSARLRITFSANHSIEDLKDLIQALQKIEQQVQVRQLS